MNTLEFTQKLPIDLESCWDFFSNPSNLKLLTPKKLGLEFKDPPPSDKIYPGQLIVYTVRPLFNLPLEWVTEITHVEKPHYFVDEQRKGPYKSWRHEHTFTPIHDGVEIRDRITYQLPYGILGALLSRKIHRDLNAIFAYRSQQLEKLFGPYQF